MSSKKRNDSDVEQATFRRMKSPSPTVLQKELAKISSERDGYSELEKNEAAYLVELDRRVMELRRQIEAGKVLSDEDKFIFWAYMHAQLDAGTRLNEIREVIFGLDEQIRIMEKICSTIADKKAPKKK